MNQQVNNLIMNADENMGQVERSPMDEQLFRKQRLAAALRIFGRFGFLTWTSGTIKILVVTAEELGFFKKSSFDVMYVFDAIWVPFWQGKSMKKSS